jgi:hypothetical protein
LAARHRPRLGRVPWSCPQPCPRASLPEPVPRWPRAPRVCMVRVPLARVACSRACDVVALRSTLILIHFNFSLVEVLRCALRRAMVHSEFIFINVLRRVLRHAMILFKFIFIKVLCRALRRATIRFKCSSVDVSRRAFRRATLNVYL